jgi:hypothetical protein
VQATDFEGLNVLQFAHKYGFDGEIVTRLEAKMAKSEAVAAPRDLTYPVEVYEARGNCRGHQTAASSTWLHSESPERIEVIWAL